MFRTVSMLRLKVLVLERDEKQVLRELGKISVLQLTRTAADGDSAPSSPRDRTREITCCDRLLARTAETQRALGAAAIPGEIADATTFERAESILASWERKTAEWLRRREQLREELEQRERDLQQVDPFSSLELPLERFTQSPFLSFLTGSLPLRGLDRVHLPSGVVVLPLSEEAGNRRILALTTPSRKAEMESTLRTAGFQQHPVPGCHGMSLKAFHAEACRDRERLAAELVATDREGKDLAKAACQPLAEIQEWVSIERRLLEAEQLFPRTDAAILITGWLPADQLSGIKQRLVEATGGRCVVQALEPAGFPQEEIPVLLRHGRLLKPFEMLVTAYGLPRYGEFSPTLFVALSYVLMFGMMFGDVGHGGLLALAGAILLAKAKSLIARHAGVLLVANGLSSVAFGLAYGSCFGLPAFKEHAFWRDPLEGDPMKLMLLAIGVGIVLMSVGLVLNISNRLRQGDWPDGLLGKFGLAGAVFYWGTLVVVAKLAVLRSNGWLGVAVLICVGIPVACWIAKEPLALVRSRAGREAAHGGILAGILESFVGAFEGLLLYLANTISFVRLAAYAMSHAALLLATFTLADQVRQMPVGGPVLSVIVIILGNLAAFGLEGIVAAVQALRLEYYEFFGKFFSGDGQPFKPFSLVPQRAA
ncbi:MAG: V-type ATP synthase subunit I [Verrucomicrobiia bacterium]